MARAAPRLVAGGDPEWFERPEWFAVRDAYGFRFAGKRNYTATFMYSALESGEADAISAFSSDGRIAADDLVVLDDPEDPTPYWLVSSRRPEKVLAALRA